MFTIKKDVKKLPKDQKKTKKKVKYTRKIWTGSKPPADNTEAYKSCEIRITNLDKQLAELDSKYKIDDANLAETVKFYGYHLERLRISEGLTDFKSSKSVTDLLNGLKSNGMNKAMLPMLKSSRQEIMNKNDEKQKEMEKTRNELSKMLEILEPSKKNSAIRLPSINQNREKSTKNLTLTKITMAQATPKIINDTDAIKPEGSKPSEEVLLENKEELNETAQEDTEKVNNNVEIVESDEYETDDEEFDDLNFESAENEENNKTNENKENENKGKINIPLTPGSAVHSGAVSPATIENKKTIMIEKMKLVNEDSAILKELFDKITDAFKHKYSLLIDEVDMLCVIFEKYFISFMQNNFENLREKFTRNGEVISRSYLDIIQKLLETSFNYNVKTQEFSDLLHDTTKGLRMMRKNFEENNILMKDFSPQIQRLSLRYDCDLIPVVFILHEFSLRLKLCTKTLKDWLFFEQSYTSYLSNDLKR